MKGKEAIRKKINRKRSIEEIHEVLGHLDDVRFDEITNPFSGRKKRGKKRSRQHTKSR